MHGLHRYYITVFALGVESLKLPGNSRYDFDAAIKGHTLAKARMMGRLRAREDRRDSREHTLSANASLRTSCALAAPLPLYSARRGQCRQP